MKNNVRALILVLVIPLAVLYVRRLMWVTGVLTPQLHSAMFTRMELEALDAAKQEYLHAHNNGASDLVTLSNLVPYLNNDTNYPVFVIRKLTQENGVDWMRNPILIGTNDIVTGGPVSDPVHVSPKTKEMLKLATGGDAYWGLYK
jgi:hypothetical protein